VPVEPLDLGDRLVDVGRVAIEVQVRRRDQALAQESRADVLVELRPVSSLRDVHHDDGQGIALARLEERQRLEALVERPEAAREEDDRVALFYERQLPREEILE